MPISAKRALGATRAALDHREEAQHKPLRDEFLANIRRIRWGSGRLGPAEHSSDTDDAWPGLMWVTLIIGLIGPLPWR